MNPTRIQEPKASRVTRNSVCEMRLTLSGSLSAGHGRLRGRFLFLTRGKQAR
jgi:hypothetical protein